MGLGIARHRSRYRDLGAWAPIRGKAKVWSWGPTGNVGEGGVFEILGKHMGMICCLLLPLHSAFFFFFFNLNGSGVGGKVAKETGICK